ncbi:hypothetical protein IHE44_0002111 [Lamprotornis superbus]|uniref:Uncharacterized protein n=1 Tax=Lamprotornis superbus TaxID=245042 RepID=A0A835NUC7_9PASS|nr:hypothetical protein IHE44_0002111 [Lamprotornis superbus]
MARNEVSPMCVFNSIEAQHDIGFVHGTKGQRAPPEMSKVLYWERRLRNAPKLIPTYVALHEVRTVLQAGQGPEKGISMDLATVTFEGFAHQGEVLELSKQGEHVNLENDFLWKQLIPHWQSRPTLLQNIILSVLTVAREVLITEHAVIQHNVELYSLVTTLTSHRQFKLINVSYTVSDQPNWTCLVFRNCPFFNDELEISAYKPFSFLENNLCWFSVDPRPQREPEATQVLLVVSFITALPTNWDAEAAPSDEDVKTNGVNSLKEDPCQYQDAAAQNCSAWLLHHPSATQAYKISSYTNQQLDNKNYKKILIAFSSLPRANSTSASRNKKGQDFVTKCREFESNVGFPVSLVCPVWDSFQAAAIPGFTMSSDKRNPHPETRHFQGLSAEVSTVNFGVTHTEKEAAGYWVDEGTANGEEVKSKLTKIEREGTTLNCDGDTWKKFLLGKENTDSINSKEHIYPQDLVREEEKGIKHKCKVQIRDEFQKKKPKNQQNN